MLHIEEKTLKKYEEDSAGNPDKKLVNKIFVALGMNLPYNDQGELTDSFGISDITDENGTEDEDINPLMITRYGTCIYCGQQALVNCDQDDPQDKADALATWNCKCETARAARRKAEQEEEDRRERLRRIDAAIFDINTLIADAGHIEVAQILCEAAPNMIDGKLKKVSISIDSRTSATILITSQGKVQVERRVVNVDQAESE